MRRQPTSTDLAEDGSPAATAGSSAAGAPATEPMTPGRRRRLGLMLGGVTAVAALSIDTYLPALPQVGQDLGASPSAVQLSLTAFLVGLAVGQLVVGPLSDVYGRRRPLLIGLAVYVVASVACVLAPSIPLLVAARLAEGLAGAAGIVVARAYVQDLFEGAEVARFFALLMLVVGVAPVLAPVLGGQLLRLGSWHVVFVFLTLFGAVLLAATFVGLKETLPPGRRSTTGLRGAWLAARTVLGDRVYVGLLLTFSLTFAAMFAYISGSSFVFQDEYGASPAEYSGIFCVGALALVVGTQLSGRLAGRLGERTLQLSGAGLLVVAAAAQLVVALLGGSLVVLVLTIAFATLGVGMVLPATTALAMGRHRESGGMASAVLGCAQMAFGGLVAPVVGLGGAPLMAATMLGCGVLALLASLTLARGA